MQDKIERLPAAKKCPEEFLQQFHEELKKRPEISDEEFMAEFEVSDEQYELGLTLSATGQGRLNSDQESEL